jgi:hypothetical protein
MEERERNRQQKTMFGNPFRLEKNESAEETWQEGINGPPVRGRKKRRKIENTESSNIMFVSDGPLDGALNNELVSKDKMMVEVDPLINKELYSTPLSLVNEIHPRGSVEAVERDLEELKRKEHNTIDSFGDVLAVQEKSVFESNMYNDPQHVAEFLISVIRILRHTRAGQTSKVLPCDFSFVLHILAF